MTSRRYTSDYQDRLEIIGLRSKYAHEFDDENWGTFGALFTGDGILDYDDRKQLEGPDESEQFGEREIS